MSESQINSGRRVRAILTVVGALCLTTSCASAQDMEAIAIDLAQYAVQVYHPRVNGAEIFSSEVSIKQDGETVRTFVRVSWESGWLPRQRRMPCTAEVQATFVIQPKRSIVYELDYIDTDSRLLANRDRTPQIIAEYNTRLERWVGLAPGASIFGPGSFGPPESPLERLFWWRRDGGGLRSCRTLRPRDCSIPRQGEPPVSGLEVVGGDSLSQDPPVDEVVPQ